MTSTSLRSGSHDLIILWALVISIALHVVAMVVVPNLQLKRLEPPKTLVVELKAPAKAAPEPEPIPAPPTPTVEPPKPKAVPKPKPKPLPKPIPAPAPVIEPTPAPQPKQPPVEAPPRVIAAPPKPEPPPAVTVPPPPPPEPPKPAGPSQQDIDAARNQYGSLLAREIAKYKQYPRVAQMRGWQGDTIVELDMDSSGKILSSRVQKSSGYEALDNQALEMVKKASPLPAPPEALRNRTFTILVPVAFRLES